MTLGATLGGPNHRKSAHIVSLVMNGVVGDSRLIKTAKAAEAAGYQATIVGIGNDTKPTQIEVEGIQVILVPSGVSDLKKEKIWPADKEKRQLWLLVESTLTAMAPVVEKLNPSLIHSHDMLGLRLGAAISRTLAAKGQIVPWIHDLHEFVVGLTTVPENYRLSSIEYERRYLRQADHLVTVSGRLAQEVQSIYNLRKAPTVVYNTPEAHQENDGPKSDVRSSLGLSPDVPLVVYIGVAKKERGCETIVSAVASLPGVHLCFVSDSGYVSSLRKLADTLGMGDRFHSLPYVPGAEVASFIRTADVGTHGLIHYPNGEVAMPNKMFEYLHAGLPMVVSDVAEMKRFVDTHGIGAVFEAENSGSCANAISLVLREKAKYIANITPALKEEFSWQRQAEKLKAIYDELLGPASKSRVLLISRDSGSLAELRTDLLKRGLAADVAVVGAEPPAGECDFYCDPTTLGDRAGVLTRLAAKNDSFVIHGDVDWPSALDRKALLAAGKNVVGLGSEDEFPAGTASALLSRITPMDELLPNCATPTSGSDTFLLRQIELRNLEYDAALMDMIVGRGRLEARLSMEEGKPVAQAKVQTKMHRKLIALLKSRAQNYRPLVSFVATMRRKLVGPLSR
jgi:glycosyltransferase involved in cell wall biosynthesis